MRPRAPSRPISCGIGRWPRAAASARFTRDYGSTSATQPRSRPRSAPCNMVEGWLFQRRLQTDPLVYSIPAHRSFADALAVGLINALGRDPRSLATGRILLPNNRAVRTVTEAFVRASDGGLVLPRLIAIGDPDIGERIGGALDPLELGDDVPPAIDPLQRQLLLARLLRTEGESAAEAMRLGAELARTMDALAIEEVPCSRLSEAAADVPELAGHWLKSIARFPAGLAR